MQLPFPLTYDHSHDGTVYGIVNTESSVCRGDGERVQHSIGTVEKRRTYTRDWHAYNGAQTHEQELFPYLLRDLCDTVPQPPSIKGRPRLPISDILFSIGVKVFSTMSTRRVMSDVRDAKAKGQIDCAPSPTAIFRGMEDASLTPHLSLLVGLSSLPLKAIESDFAADATGFSTLVYDRWFDHKWGKNRRSAQWVKAHIVTGVVSNIVVAVEVTPGHAADEPQLPQLLRTTASNFQMDEVSADKAYLSMKNLMAIQAMGAKPFIPFKINSVLHDGHSEKDVLWNELWHYYALHRTDFYEHYHKRSNVESTFSMVKAKFGAAVRCKNHDAQVNEVLAKFLCHNICVVIQSMYEFGIKPAFREMALGTNGHSASSVPVNGGAQAIPPGKTLPEYAGWSG